MVTPVGLCGAECGQNAAGAGDGVAHVATIGAATTVQTGGGFTAGSHSLRSWKFNPAAAITDTFQLRTSTVASPATFVARFMLMFTVLPNAIHSIVSENAGIVGIRYNPTGTKLEAWAGDPSPVFAGSFVPVVNTWYRIDIKGVRNTTATMDWQVDGAAQTQASKASQTAGAFSGFSLGHQANGTAGSTTTTTTFYVDDICISGTSGDYPIGAGKIVGLYPNADGTHLYSASTDFAYNNTVAVNNTSSLETGTSANLQNPLTSSVGNFMAMNGGTSTEYLEWQFANLPVVPSVINGITVVSTHHSAAAAANTESLNIEDGGSEGVVFALTSFPHTTISFAATTFATAPSTGAWTKPKVDALKARWGYSNDISPVPFIDGVCVEVDAVVPPVMNGYGKGQAVNRAASY